MQEFNVQTKANKYPVYSNMQHQNKMLRKVTQTKTKLVAHRL